jgi:hypothetical protein
MNGPETVITQLVGRALALTDENEQRQGAMLIAWVAIRDIDDINGIRLLAGIDAEEANVRAGLDTDAKVG